MADGDAVTLGFGVDQLALDAAQFGVAVEDEIDGGIGQGWRFLGNAGDVPAGGDFDVAGFGVQLVGEQREQAGFAAAVGADDADFPAGVELNGSVDNQWAAGAGEGDLAEGDHEAVDYSEAGSGYVFFSDASRLLRTTGKIAKIRNITKACRAFQPFWLRFATAC